MKGNVKYLNEWQEQRIKIEELEKEIQKLRSELEEYKNRTHLLKKATKERYDKLEGRITEAIKIVNEKHENYSDLIRIKLLLQKILTKDKVPSDTETT